MLNFKIAFKFIFKKPIQSLITILIITIGVAVFYFIYNASQGLKKVVLSATAETGSHLYIKGDFDFDSYSDNSVSDFREELFNNDNRLKTISYALTLPSIVNRLYLNRDFPVLLKGMDFKEGANIQNIRSRIASGDDNRLPKTLIDDPNFFGEVAVGHLLAQKLGFNDPQDAIDAPLKFDIVIDKKTIETVIFKVVSVYQSSYLELAEKMAFTTIETLHKLEALKGKANLIELKTNNPLNSDQVEENINTTIKNYYPDSSLTNWQEGNGYIVNALYIEDTSIYIIQFFTAVSIAVGLASIIVFSLRDKLNQIGILKAMGITNFNTSLIFLIQVVFFLIIGSLLGLFLGDFLSQGFMLVFRRPTVNSPLVPLVTGIKNHYALITVLIMFSSSFLAALVPLRWIKNLRIIEVIKNE